MKKFSLLGKEMHQIVAEIDQLTVEFMWEQVKNKLPIYSNLAADEIMLYLSQRIGIKIICTVREDMQSREKEIKHFYKELKRLSKLIKTIKVFESSSSLSH